MQKKFHVRYILLSIGYIAIAGLLVNLSEVLTIVLPFSNKEIENLILFGIFACLGFVVIPYLITKNLLISNLLKKLNYRKINLVIDIAIIIICSIFVFPIIDSVHCLIVGICEEFLFRFIIFNILKLDFSKHESMLIGAILFGVILHLNGNFLINIITKIPIGLILYIIYDKFGLQDSILAHWLYDCCVMKFL